MPSPLAKSIAEHAWDDGWIDVGFAGSSAVVVTLTGRLDGATAQWLTGQLDAVVSGQVITLFVDTSAVTSFGATFRTTMTGWMVRNRRQLAGAHVLTERPMIRVAAAVANMALGGWIRKHDDSASFEAAVQESAVL